MTKFNLKYDNFSRNLIKGIFVGMFGFFMMSCAHAVPTGVPPVVGNVINQFMPLLIWLFTLGGGIITGTKGWQCLYHGQIKAGAYAVGGLIATGVGFNGLFAENALTVLI